MTLKREFKEEINIDIVIKDFLGISENIFTYEGKNAHELVFYYNINILDKIIKKNMSLQMIMDKAKLFGLILTNLKMEIKYYIHKKYLNISKYSLLPPIGILERRWNQ